MKIRLHFKIIVDCYSASVCYQETITHIKMCYEGNLNLSVALISEFCYWFIDFSSVIFVVGFKSLTLVSQNLLTGF